LRPAPLFYYGICFLLGISTRILFHPAYLVVLVFFLREKWISHMAIFAAGFAYAALTVSLPTLPEEGIEAEGMFYTESVSYGQSPFGTSYVTKGKWRGIHCQIYTPLHKERPIGNQMIKGRLLPKTFPNYVLKPSQIEPQPSFFCVAEWRFQIKDWARHQFNKLFPSKGTASFLLSMVTGEIDDRLMSLQFNRLGLLHLLGISGFQFSLLALLLGSILGKRNTLLLIIILTTYTLILGNSPPIQRAWIGVTLYAIARVKGLQISPLNALGAALIWELFLDPLVYFQLGFQFSFLCTAAIFIVYPPLREFFTKWLPHRSFTETRALSPLDQVGHTLTFFCRETVALNIAIHLVSLPLILFHFHKFPLLSLAYNLFLPGAVSLAYFFLIPGLLLEPIAHFLAVPFLTMAEYLTQGMLYVATNPPTLFDFQWRVPNFSLSWALLSLTLLYLLFYERSRLLNRIGRR
jgi:competence protein ComEC